MWWLVRAYASAHVCSCMLPGAGLSPLVLYFVQALHIFTPPSPQRTHRQIEAVYVCVCVFLQAVSFHRRLQESKSEHRLLQRVVSPAKLSESNQIKSED